GHREVLLEVQELVALGELRVEDGSREQAEPGQQERGSARVEAERDQQAAAQLDGDGNRQELLRHAECARVGRRRRVVTQLRDALVQEDGGQQQAAGQEGHLLQVADERAFDRLTCRQAWLWHRLSPSPGPRAPRSPSGTAPRAWSDWPWPCRAGPAR